MKQLLLLCFFASSLTIAAQNDFRFADSTSEWNDLSTYICQTGPCIYYSTYPFLVQGDTVLNGKNYQVIRSLTQLYLLRKDSLNRTYAYHNDTVDQLIFDFNVQAGDTIHSQNAYSNNDLAVDSVDTVYWDKPRRRVFGKVTNWGIPIEMVDGVGVVSSAPLFNPFANEVDGPTYDLLCFYVNGSIVFYNSKFSSCYIDSVYNGIDEKPLNAVRVYPNPADGFVVFDLSNLPATEYYLLITNAVGQILKQMPVNSTNFKLETTGFAPGVYFYQVTDEKRKISSGKFVAQ